MSPWLPWLAIAWAGTLRGVVQDQDGAPVTGATVTVLDPRLAWAETTTDAQGAWSIDDLPPNPYRVRIRPDEADNLQERYAPAEGALCDGATFDVPRDGTVSGADGTLPPGGILSGRVVDAGRVPVVGATLATETSLAEASPRIAFTDAAGRFVLNGVPTDEGEVRVAVDVAGIPSQYLGGTTLPELALAVSPSPGESLELGEQPLVDGISVGGTVYGPDGAPVGSGTVRAYTPSQLRSTPIAPDGTWEVRGLPPGDVLAWAEVDGLATTYWPDADRPRDRLPILAQGEVGDDMDLFLPRAATVRGRLSGELDWTGTSVLLHNSDRTVAVAGVVTADGRFEITGLHGGEYTLFVRAEPLGFVAGFLEQDGDDRVIAVPHEGEVELGEVTVPQGASVHGSVRHEGTGQPVFGATVYVGSEGSPGVEIGSVQPDGTYRVGGLPAGPWRLWVAYGTACPGDPAFVPLHHPDQPNPAFAVPVDLREGEELRWDVVLPPDDDHDEMSDLWEIEHGLDPERDDGFEDPDRDGYSNLEEYLLGTDPRDGRDGCGCESGAWSGAALPSWLFRR